MTLTRGKSMKRRSNKAAAFARELDRITPQLVERAGYQCEARTEVCLNLWWSPADGELCDWRFNRHHLAGRVGPLANDLSRLLLCCGPCHSHIHANPTLSYVSGWLIKRGSITDADVVMEQGRGT